MTYPDFSPCLQLSGSSLLAFSCFSCGRTFRSPKLSGFCSWASGRPCTFLGRAYSLGCSRRRTERQFLIMPFQSVALRSPSPSFLPCSFFAGGYHGSCPSRSAAQPGSRADLREKPRRPLTSTLGLTRLTLHAQLIHTYYR